jgi:diguanylate cyclase
MVKKVLLILALIALIWWFRLFFLKLQSGIENELWVVFFTFIPFIGGINGLLVSKKWGGWKSVLGKSIILISLGLLGWAIGNFIWSYFTLIQNIAVPYPSIADMFFFSIVPTWSLGMYFLIKALGGKFAWKTLHGKMFIIIPPVIGFIIAYFMFLKGLTFPDNSIDLKSFLDIAYPLGDTLTITLSLLALGVSAKMLGGRMRIPVLILILGFVIQYFADFSFSYTTSTGTFFNGHWVDLAYMFAQLSVGYGLASIETKE